MHFDTEPPHPHPITPSYVQVDYANLASYLTTASDTEVNYIEITGNVPATEFKGYTWPSNLGKKIKAASGKRIALKIPENIPNLTNMEACFKDCTNLVSVANIPATVTNMLHCFDGCTGLETVTLNNAYLQANFSGIFENCSALKEGGIRVKAEHYASYTSESALTDMKVPGSNKDEKRAKFTGIIPYADFDNLKNYLRADGVNRIEITGNIPPQDFWREVGGPGPDTTVLGRKIKNAQKKIAVILPAGLTGITRMTYCFKDCTNLVSVENIPESVTDMLGCFSGCKDLISAPRIPSGVTRMTGCFADCKNLEEGPVIPASVTVLMNCFGGCSSLKRVKLECAYISSSFNTVFNNCTGLEDGGIKVKTAHYDAYTAAAALNNMKVPPLNNETEQKKKFSRF